MKKNQGFTLIELLLVVIIIGVLSGVILSVINVSGLRARARDAQRAGDLKKVQTALELYFADFRGYPQSSSVWELINTSGGGALGSALNGSYIKNIPQDPRDGEAMTTAQCGLGNFGYYYKTDSCSGTGCLAARYVIATFMETASSADASACSSIVNCSSGNVSSCNCASPCYGVENPL